MSNLTAAKPRLSFQAQTVAILAAVAAAVALPQFFHLMGRAAGIGTALGELFLPMHLSILLVGLLAGPVAGAIAGAASPLVSFLLTGMPGSAMLPFMVLELFGYGLAAGLLRRAKLPVVVKVLIAQIAGRALRAAAILLAVYAFGSTAVPVSLIWTSIGTGVFGIALQLCLIPLLVYRIEHLSRHDA